MDDTALISKPESYTDGSGGATTKERSSSSSSIEDVHIRSSAFDTKPRPFFYFQNTTQSQTNNFVLHSHPSNCNYSTTLTIIILLHVIYFFQWNGRQSRRDVCTNYDQLVNKKQFYRAAIAIASHPPVDGGEINSNTGDENLLHATVDDGGLESSRVSVATFLVSRICSLFRGMSSISQRLFSFCRFLYRNILHPFIHGSLSGLPLLTFTSHILWQCRALEELYDVYDGKLILGITDDINLSQVAKISTIATEVRNVEDMYIIDMDHLAFDAGYSYFRVLVALAFTSILIELSFLRLTKNRHGSNQYRSQWAICSTASLSSAILGVYNSRFPYAPPPVLPFIRVSFLSSSGFSFLFSILILTLLTRKIHLVTSIGSGLLSGTLWSMGLTSFLGTQYWGNVVLMNLVMAILLSLKAQPFYSKYLEIFVPCLDHVAWSRHGNVNDVQEDSSHGEDLEMGQRFRVQNGDRHERFPLLLSQSSSVSAGSGRAIRGRVPLINSMESDLDGTDDWIRNNSEETIPAASTRFGASVLRRTGGSSIE